MSPYLLSTAAWYPVCSKYWLLMDMMNESFVFNIPATRALRPVLFNMAAISHRWLLSACSVAQTEMCFKQKTHPRF